MSEFENAKGCFCIGETMTCDLCFVPALFICFNFFDLFLLKGPQTFVEVLNGQTSEFRS